MLFHRRHAVTAADSPGANVAQSAVTARETSQAGVRDAFRAVTAASCVIGPSQSQASEVSCEAPDNKKVATTWGVHW